MRWIRAVCADRDLRMAHGERGSRCNGRRFHGPLRQTVDEVGEVDWYGKRRASCAHDRRCATHLHVFHEPARRVREPVAAAEEREIREDFL